MSLLIQLNEELGKKKQAQLIREWRELSAEMTLFASLAKKMGERISEIEDAIMPIVDAATEHKDVINGALLEVKVAKGKTTYSYSDLFTRALEIATDDQKAVLLEYKESISKIGEDKKSLKIVDPKLQNALKSFRKDMTIAELKQMIVDIAKLPTHDGLEEASIMQMVKDAVKSIITALKPVSQAQKKAAKSAKAFADIAKNPELEA